MRYTCRSDDSLYWIRRRMLFPNFFFQVFFFFFFFLGVGGGGAKASVILPKILPPSLSRKYAFSGFEKQLHKNYGTNIYQIWYNGASYHRTDLSKIWHFSLKKGESRNFSFLFIPLTRTPMFRTAMRSHVRYFDPLVYLFIYFNKIARC